LRNNKNSSREEIQPLLKLCGRKRYFNKKRSVWIKAGLSGSKIESYTILIMVSICGVAIALIFSLDSAFDIIYHFPGKGIQLCQSSKSAHG
jgi:hypothetical protein